MYQYTAYWLILYFGVKLQFSAIIDFYLFFDGSVDM